MTELYVIKLRVLKRTDRIPRVFKRERERGGGSESEIEGGDMTTEAEKEKVM